MKLISELDTTGPMDEFQVRLTATVCGTTVPSVRFALWVGASATAQSHGRGLLNQPPGHLYSTLRR